MTRPITGTTRHLTASMAVFDPAHRTILLIHNNSYGRVQLPGGHVDPDEAPHEAAVREVREECGITPLLITGPPIDLPYGQWAPPPVMTAEFPAPPKPARGEPGHWHIDLLYVGVADNTKPLTARPEEVASAHWAPIHNLADTNVRPDVPAAVAAAWAWYETAAG